MKVCIYLRKSRADREHQDLPLEDVLKNHETILLDYAQKSALEILEIKKEVVSGESLARRPEMLQLLDEVEEGLYDAVLVKDFDRLGRGNMMEQGIIIEAFRKSGTKIITPDKLYDLENEFDEEYIDISAFFARKELKMITKRLHSGRMKSVADGNYISPYAPYGYDKKDKTLIINERESEVVRMIFELYANQGYGDTKIANYLTSHGLPNKHGSCNWDKTTIRNIIRNPVYTGKITWNKRIYRYQENGKRSSNFIKSKLWKVFDGRHRAIISEELFDKAQHATGRNTSPRLQKSKSLRNPMANMMRCGFCGSAMTLRTAAGRSDALRCYRNCGESMSSGLPAVENRLIFLLAQHFSGTDFSIFNSDAKTRSDMECSFLMRSLERSRAGKSRLQFQMDSLYDLLEQKVYCEDTFFERKKKISESMQQMDERIEAINAQLSGLSSAEKSAPRINDLRQFIVSIYGKLDAKNRNELLKDIISTVIYRKPKGSLKDGFTLDIVLRN